MADRSYQVLARKWRPRTFDQVVGQAAIVRTLSNALEQGRVAHAYCFSGIRGVGKTTIARLVAKGLNCRSVEAPTAQPCGTCEACVEIEESRNLDVVETDAASQTGVDNIRQLNEFARYTPSRDRYRVFIIDEAHMLSAPAFNALLKTLEEPPAHVVFMLATTEPHKILPTVLSRCQHYPLGRISQAEITGRLREIVEAEGVAISEDGLSMVAMAADGSLRDAQSLLDKLIAFGGEEIDDDTVAGLLGMVDRELLFGVTDLVSQQDLAGVLGFVNRMVEQGVDLHQFALDLLGHLRALLVVATVGDASEILHLPDGDLERLQGQAEAFEVDDLDRAFSLLSASEYRIKSSDVPRYELEMVLSRLARMPRLEPIESLIAQLRGGAGGASGAAGGGAPGGGGAQKSGGGTASRRARVTRSAGGSALGPGDAAASGTNGGGAQSRGGPSTAEEAPGTIETPAAPPPSPGGGKEASRTTEPPVETSAATASSLPAESPPPPTTPPPAASSPPPAPPAASAPGPGQPAATSAAGVSPPPAASASTGTPGRRPGTSPASNTAVGGPEIEIIVDRIRADKPIIAKMVERADSAELRGDTLFLTFQESGGIFRARLRDRSALSAIEEAAEAALGRKIKVVAGFDENTAEGAGSAAGAGSDNATDPDPQERERNELWQRAEEEPLVRQFVDALRGNLIDVDDL